MSLHLPVITNSELKTFRRCVRDVSGDLFGRWTVIGPSDKRASSKTLYVRCRCACGQERDVNLDNLKRGLTTSCGCYAAENSARCHTTHGCARGSGLSPEYRIWRSMKNRCCNSNVRHYVRYGGRGISVCDRWMKFEDFLADMGPRPTPGHSIDRIDNDGNYEPGNCRWATAKEQRANQRPRGAA